MNVVELEFGKFNKENLQIVEKLICSHNVVMRKKLEFSDMSSALKDKIDPITNFVVKFVIGGEVCKESLALVSDLCKIRVNGNLLAKDDLPSLASIILDKNGKSTTLHTDDPSYVRGLYHLDVDSLNVKFDNRAVVNIRRY